MMQQQLAEGWSRHAHQYARLGASFTGYIAQALFHSVSARLPPRAQLLEVACGNGELSRAAVMHCMAELAETGACGSVTATDFSEGMLEQARRNLQGLCPEGMVRLEVHDGQALGFESEQFDAVFSSFGIFLFPDRRAGWREAARVLRSGGYFGTAVWRGPEENQLVRMQLAPMMRALPERLRTPHGGRGWLEIATPDALVEEVCAAGFQDPELSVFHAVLTSPSPRTMWKVMQNNPVSGQLLSQCTPEELAVVEASVLSEFEALAGGPDRPLKLDASCHLLIVRRV